MRGDSGPRFAPQNIVQARERTPLVVEPIVVEKRITDTPPRETIDNNVELVFSRTFGRRAVPSEDALIKTVHLIDDR